MDGTRVCCLDTIVTNLASPAQPKPSRMGIAQGSHEPASRHAYDTSRRNHQVIEHPHAHQLQGFNQLMRDRSVCGAGFCHTAWVIVREDCGASIDVECSSHDFPWVDARTIYGPDEELLAIEDPVAIVEPHDVEFFVEQCAQAHAEKVACFARVADVALAFELALQDAFGRCQHVRFRGLAREPVVALAVFEDAHVLSPRRWIAPWAFRKRNGKGMQHPEPAAVRQAIGRKRSGRGNPCAGRREATLAHNRCKRVSWRKLWTGKRESFVSIETCE
jgi:hypothetical protein